MRTLRIAACGNSIFIRGIADRLAADGVATVGCFDPTMPDARRSIEEFAPNAIALDPGAAFLVLPIALSLEQPDVLLVVLQPGSERVHVLCDRQYQPETAADLVDTLTRILSASDAGG